MKIRSDFVTNSSSSSFTCVALYSEELYEYLQKLVKEKKYINQPEWSWYRPEDGLYLDWAWEELSFDKRLNKVQTTEEYGGSDKESIYKYICSFFKDLSSEERDSLKDLISEVYANKNYQTKKYKDYTDGFTGFNFEELKKKDNKSAKKKGQTTQHKATAEKETSGASGKVYVTTGLEKDEEKLVKQIVEKRGDILKANFVVGLNCLIVNSDYDHETTKLRKAKELIANGKDVEIISYAEFLEQEGLAASGVVVVEGYDSETKPDVDFPYYEAPVYYVEEIDLSEKEAKAWEYKDDWGYREGEIWISDYVGDEKHIIVPSAINGRKVTGISRHGFSKCGALSLEIPGGLILEDTIGFGNDSLQSLTIGEGCTSIGGGSFAIRSLEDVKVSRSVSHIDTSESDFKPFQETRWAKRTLEEEGLLIAGSVLIDVANKQEKRLIIPEGISEIGPHALGNAAEEIILPPSIKTISKFAFWNNYREGPNLKTLIFPNSISRIDKYAFDRTEWIEHFGNSTLVISNQLYQVSSLEKVSDTITIPEGVTGICEDVLSNNIHFRKLHNKQEQIRANVKRIVFPETLKHIDRSALEYFRNIEHLILPEGFESIEDKAFQNCESLQSVDFPGSLKSIGKSAFCFSALSSLTLQNSLESIGNAAFLCCKYLEEIELPCDLNYLGSSAFQSCGAIKRIILPSHIDHIGENLISCRGNTIEYMGIKVPIIEKEGHTYYREPDANVLLRYKEELIANNTVYLDPVFPDDMIPMSFCDFEHLLNTGEYKASTVVIQITKDSSKIAHEEAIKKELKYNLKNLSAEEKLDYVTELLKTKVEEGGKVIVAASTMEAIKKLKELYPDLPVQFMGRWTKEVLNKDAYTYLMDKGLVKGAE